ncbi:hypothetical protein SAMN05192585_11240 [Acetanaerobacterium elongatum]|uniref:Uncharacterized protein n=1 Tax=Acetanaerobacterium elongatum TaxID=258515 RepID=A0A1G9YZJ0_9FIRM|nr:hypothetical protein SAMN05192585_11240 [Acetanaerobacterium elongatum]
MPRCSKCGKSVAVAPIICGECQQSASAAAEDLLQKICDGYCHWPWVIKDQEKMSAKCDGCEIEAMVYAMTGARQ